MSFCLQLCVVVVKYIGGFNEATLKPLLEMSHYFSYILDQRM
jgi:hypothetical protein